MNDLRVSSTAETVLAEAIGTFDDLRLNGDWHRFDGREPVPWDPMLIAAQGDGRSNAAVLTRLGVTASDRQGKPRGNLTFLATRLLAASAWLARDDPSYALLLYCHTAPLVADENVAERPALTVLYAQRGHESVLTTDLFFSPDEPLLISGEPLAVHWYDIDDFNDVRVRATHRTVNHPAYLRPPSNSSLRELGIITGDMADEV